MPKASVCAILLIWEILRVERLEGLDVGYPGGVSRQKKSDKQWMKAELNYNE
jgi:hypothetical protein